MTINCAKSAIKLTEIEIFFDFFTPGPDVGNTFNDIDVSTNIDVFIDIDVSNDINVIIIFAEVGLIEAESQLKKKNYFTSFI